MNCQIHTNLPNLACPACNPGQNQSQQSLLNQAYMNQGRLQNYFGVNRNIVLSPEEELDAKFADMELGEIVSTFLRAQKEYIEAMDTEHRRRIAEVKFAQENDSTTFWLWLEKKYKISKARLLNMKAFL
jgi:hypothetical protein